MIRSIPDALRAELPAIRDHWVQVGLSCQPVDRAVVTAAVHRMYAEAGKPAPKFIIILESPLAVCIAIAMMRMGHDWREVHEQVSDQVHEQVSDQVHDQVSAQVSDQVHDQVRAQVSAQVRAQVSEQVRDQVRDQVSDQVHDQVAEIINSWFWWYGFGQFETYWCAYYDVMARLGATGTERLLPMMDLAQSAGWTVPFWDWVFVSRRPSVPVQRDARNRLHCTTGPAVGYADGFGVYAVHGVRVRRYIIEEPSKITVHEIDRERNAEVRRVMMERYGESRYLMDSGAQLLDSSLDKLGNLRQLYRKEIPGDEPLVMVRVVNSTQEPDGTFKTYFMRVNPELRPMWEEDGQMKMGEPQAMTALNAVASTFGERGEEYDPVMET